MVADNMTVVREATSPLVEMPGLTTEAIVEVHAALLPNEPRRHGLRTVQNWIGGSDWHPLDADFVPPTPDEVRPLMDDLAAYVKGAAHSPIAQAALVHAQFETIHPFTDGSGRVGRALIHTVLARRGFTTDAILPISLALSTLRETYVEGLTIYRTDAPPLTPAGLRARAVGPHVRRGRVTRLRASRSDRTRTARDSCGLGRQGHPRTPGARHPHQTARRLRHRQGALAASRDARAHGRHRREHP